MRFAGKAASDSILSVMTWNDERIKEHFSFICPNQWHEMQETDDERIRYCDSCEKNVTDVRSEQEFRAILMEGGCASVVMANGEAVVSAPSESDENPQPLPPPPDIEEQMRTSGTIPDHARREMEAAYAEKEREIHEHGIRTSGTIPEGYLKEERKRARNKRIGLLLVIAIPLIGLAALYRWLFT